MPFAAAVSTLAQTGSAIDEVCSHVAAELGGRPDLVLLFFSNHHAAEIDLLARSVTERLNPICSLGCIAEGVIGQDIEVEQDPGLSLWAVKWTSPVSVDPFHLTLELTADGTSLMGMPDALVGASGLDAVVLMLGDPFTFPAEVFLQQMNDDCKGLRVLGGMASGIRGPGQVRLLLNGKIHNEGAVGVLLQGPVGLRPIVSQGCRPIGQPMLVTRRRERTILELGGRDPLEQLKHVWQSLSLEDQRLYKQGLQIGRVISEYRDVFQRGDFLVRNIIEYDKQTGGLTLTDSVRVGQTIQFHIRDAATADEDLRALLQLDVAAHDKKPAAALVFSCNGRGSRLFSVPHHDARTICQEVGSIPLAGFFAMGELGPVGGLNFQHGYTASIALFEE